MGNRSPLVIKRNAANRKFKAALTVLEYLNIEIPQDIQHRREYT